MADNKAKRGKGDRARVAAGEGYEVSYFARKHDITTDQALKLIERIGNDRDKLERCRGEAEEGMMLLAVAAYHAAAGKSSSADTLMLSGRTRRAAMTMSFAASQAPMMVSISPLGRRPRRPLARAQRSDRHRAIPVGYRCAAGRPSPSWCRVHVVRALR